jgi:hypothetical protein
MQRVIPNDSTIRRETIDPLFSEKITKIQQKISDNSVYFILDETTDSSNRLVFNILLGALNGFYSRPMLLLTTFVEKTNYLTISKAFVNTYSILWANNIQNDKVLLVVKDQASYLLKPCEHLKINFPNLNHITCLAHCLNRVCEKIRIKFIGVNSLISNIKNNDQMSAKTKSFFAKKTGLKLPKYPCITRWGTWLNAAFYYKNNCNKVKSFILELNDESIAIMHIKKIFRKKSNKTRSFVNILL